MKMIAAISAATLLLAGCEAEKAQTLGKPPSPGPDQHVFLIWKPTNQWMVRLNNDPNEKAPAQARIKLNQGIGPTKFIVHIVGNPGASFKNPGGLSVWEGAGAKSQPQQGINSTQILGPYLDNGNLVFYDLNYGNGVELNYALHFNGSVPSVDPIIDNGGGTWN